MRLIIIILSGLYLSLAGSFLSAADMSDEDRQIIVEVLEKEEGKSCVKALYALGRASVSDKKTMALASRKLQSKIPSVRAAAVYALGRSDEKTYLRNIIEMLGDPSWLVRIEVYKAISKLGGRKAMRLAGLKGLNDKDMSVQLEALECLGKSILAEDVERVLKYCERQTSDLHSAKALDAVSVGGFDLDKDRIIVYFDTKRPLTCSSAIRLAGVTKKRELLVYLRKLFSSSIPLIRRSVISACVSIGSQSGKEMLLKGFADTDNSVRQQAARLAPGLADESLVKSLFGLHSDRYRNVRRQSSSSLIQMALKDNDRKKTILVMAVENVKSSEDRRREGYYIIGKLKAKDAALQVLERVKSLNSQLDNRLFAWVIAECGMQEGAEFVLSFLDAGDQPLRYQSAVAVGRLKYAPAVGKMLALLKKTEPVPMSSDVVYYYKDPERKELLRSLGMIGSEEAKAAVIDKLSFTKVLETADCYRILFKIAEEKRLKEAAGHLRSIYAHKTAGSDVKYLVVKSIEKLTGKKSDLELPEIKDSHARFFIESR
ncbi:MAG: HEAT repeat domain-containing protein [Planctomycetota bacterium]|jgi:HEAT repeat protein